MPDSFDSASHSYVPILVTRRGERIAMRETDPVIKTRLTPLWVVAPVPWDFENEEPAKTVEAHIENLPSDLLRDWGTGSAFVDTAYLPDDLIGGVHPLEFLVRQAALLGLPLVPVTGPERSVDHIAAAATLANSSSLGPGGVCLRIPRNMALSLQAPPALARWSIDDLLTALNLAPDAIDVLIDFGEDVSDALATATLVRAILANFPYLADWRSITFAGTSIPSSLQGVPTQAVSSFDRPEWEAYEDLLQGSNPARMPRFGDYAVQHPELITDVDPKVMRIFSQLRYATDNGWLVGRGQELRRVGNAHVSALAGLLVAQPEYAGAAFSPGDRWISDCAAGTVNPGSPEIWRRASTSHHLAHAVIQVARALRLPTP